MNNIMTNVNKRLGDLNGAYAPNTLKSYYADARAFVDWCRERNLEPFPIASKTLCAYIECLQLNPATDRVAQKTKQNAGT